MREKFKLIVTDMDGTLLDAEHRLPQHFKAYVQALRTRNVRWVIASGRQLANLKAQFDAIDVAVDIIAENGALAQCTEDASPFFEDLTAVSVFQKILRAVSEISGATPVLCGATCAWVQDTYPENFKEISIYFNQTTLWHHIKEVSHLNICKVAVYHPNAATMLYPQLSTFATTEMRVILSGPNWVDIQIARIDKGNALKALMKRFNCFPEEVIVFGDYLNDVGMMESGVYAVAMANAHTDVLAITPHHALANTQNGVIDTLRRLNIL